MVKKDNALDRFIFQHFRGRIEGATAEAQYVFDGGNECPSKMHPRFVIQRRPCLDVLNLTIQNEDFAKLGMIEALDPPKAPPTRNHGSELLERNAHTPKKMRNSALLPPHQLQSIISSYPRLSAGALALPCYNRTASPCSA